MRTPQVPALNGMTPLGIKPLRNGKTMTLKSFKVTLDGGNDAMRTQEDVARALETIAARVRNGTRSSNVRDENGNVVGDFIWRNER